MNVGIKLIRIASVYMLVGLVVGIVMAVSKDFVLSSLHSHILLLGWTTMAIAGIVYLVTPRRAESRLARLHYWGHNAGLPVMIVSLALFRYGYDAAEPIIGVGSIIILTSLVAFTVNVFSARHVRPDQNEMFTISSPPPGADPHVKVA